jgi:hypothetical protein
MTVFILSESLLLLCNKKKKSAVITDVRKVQIYLVYHLGFLNFLLSFDIYIVGTIYFLET